MRYCGKPGCPGIEKCQACDDQQVIAAGVVEPFEIWRLAAGDIPRYVELMKEYGHIALVEPPADPTPDQLQDLKVRRLRLREAAALIACTCLYPIERYRNGHGHKPTCPGARFAKGLGMSTTGDE